jgi:hypothetical protein
MRRWPHWRWPLGQSLCGLSPRTFGRHPGVPVDRPGRPWWQCRDRRVGCCAGDAGLRKPDVDVGGWAGAGGEIGVTVVVRGDGVMAGLELVVVKRWLPHRQITDRAHSATSRLDHTNCEHSPAPHPGRPSGQPDLGNNSAHKAQTKVGVGYSRHAQGDTTRCAGAKPGYAPGAVGEDMLPRGAWSGGARPVGGDVAGLVPN